MLSVLLFLISGIVGGIILRKFSWLPKLTERFITITIYLLLFTLGIKAGADKNITSQLQTLGITALLISSFAITGSVFLVWFVFKYFFKNNQP